nr:hypothetical protein [Pseudomonas sp. NMI1173_11]
MLVDAHHHVQCTFLLHWSADHHTFDALIQVGLEHSYRLHLTAGLDDQVAARPVGVGDGLVRGEPAKQFTDVGAGPEGMTVKAADDKTLKEYLETLKK